MIDDSYSRLKCKSQIEPNLYPLNQMFIRMEPNIHPLNDPNGCTEWTISTHRNGLEQLIIAETRKFLNYPRSYPRLICTERTDYGIKFHPLTETKIKKTSHNPSMFSSLSHTWNRWRADEITLWIPKVLTITHTRCPTFSHKPKHLPLTKYILLCLKTQRPLANSP